MGAVYQDLTHTNIALIGSNNYLTKDIIQKILLGTFDPLNIEVVISDQLECLIDNKKVPNTALSENNHYCFFIVRSVSIHP